MFEGWWNKLGIQFLAVAGFAISSTALSPVSAQDSWNCRNIAVEITCGGEKCEVADNHTPMDVTIGLNGKMAICAYSGCWEGQADGMFSAGPFLTLSSKDIRWSNEPEKTGVAASVTIDTKAKVAVVMVGEYSHPMPCKARGTSK